jgi:hypothetical protein
MTIPYRVHDSANALTDISWSVCLLIFCIAINKIICLTAWRRFKADNIFVRTWISSILKMKIEHYNKVMSIVLVLTEHIC